MQALVTKGKFWQAVADAVAQYSLVEVEVVMPAAQELEGMQNVSPFEAPGSRV